MFLSYQLFDSCTYSNWGSWSTSTNHLILGNQHHTSLASHIVVCTKQGYGQCQHRPDNNFHLCQMIILALLILSDAPITLEEGKIICTRFFFSHWGWGVMSSSYYHFVPSLFNMSSFKSYISYPRSRRAMEEDKTGRAVQNTSNLGELPPDKWIVGC